MSSRDFFEIGVPILIGLMVALAGFRSKQPSRDLLLLAVPALVWTVVHLTLLAPPTNSSLANVFLLGGPLVAVFIFLAMRWEALGRAE